MLYAKVKGVYFNVSNMNWKNVPEPFDSMEYELPNKKRIILNGFDEYVRLKEHHKGLNNSIDRIGALILMGKSFNKVAIVRIDLAKNKVFQDLKEVGKEYNGKSIDSRFWKKGIRGQARVLLKH